MIFRQIHFAPKFQGQQPVGWSFGGAALGLLGVSLQGVMPEGKIEVGGSPGAKVTGSIFS